MNFTYWPNEHIKYAFSFIHTCVEVKMSFYFNPTCEPSGWFNPLFHNLDLSYSGNASRKKW